MLDTPYAIDVAVCICTRNRPDDLARALDSVAASAIAVSQVIVSDDSTDDRTRTLIAERYPHVTFIEGPRRGLCHNRNAALRAVRTKHILFIDDDATLGNDFFNHVAFALANLPPSERSRTIVSGIERQGDRLIFPSDETFFGYQERPYRHEDRINTIVINATVFPTALFVLLGFDRNLVYGSDEVDLATRAVAIGFRIALARKAINNHHPSPVNRDFYRSRVEASRLYVTFKRYAFTQRHILRALSYVVLAPLHLIGASVKRGGLSGIGAAVASVLEAGCYFARYIRHASDVAAIGAT